MFLRLIRLIHSRQRSEGMPPLASSVSSAITNCIAPAPGLQMPKKNDSLKQHNSCSSRSAPACLHARPRRVTLKLRAIDPQPVHDLQLGLQFGRGLAGRGQASRKGPGRCCCMLLALLGSTEKRNGHVVSCCGRLGCLDDFWVTVTAFAVTVTQKLT